MKAAYVISILFGITASNSAISFVGNEKSYLLIIHCIRLNQFLTERSWRRQKKGRTFSISWKIRQNVQQISKNSQSINKDVCQSYANHGVRASKEIVICSKQMLHSRCQGDIVRRKIVELICILFHQANLEFGGSSGGSLLLPFQNCPVFSRSHNFPYLFRLT